MLHESKNFPDPHPATDNANPPTDPPATTAPSGPPDDPPPVPGYKNIRLYCDESGIHGAKYIGFGSLWMPHERRGDFQAIIDEQRRIHRNHDELKWSRVSAGNEAFADAVICEFFKRSWLMFHALILRVGYIDMSHHESRDEQLRKHMAMLLSTKIKYFADGKKKAFHVIVDPIPSPYKKAGEAAHVIIGHTLRRDVGDKVLIKSLTERDSKDTAGIQLADLLLGASLCPWQGDVTAEPKKRISRLVAMHLGWATCLPVLALRAVSNRRPLATACPATRCPGHPLTTTSPRLSLHFRAPPPARRLLSVGRHEPQASNLSRARNHPHLAAPRLDEPARRPALLLPDLHGVGMGGSHQAVVHHAVLRSLQVADPQGRHRAHRGPTPAR